MKFNFLSNWFWWSDSLYAGKTLECIRGHMRSSPGECCQIAEISEYEISLFCDEFNQKDKTEEIKRLIAAAPEMLKMLKNIKSGFDTTKYGAEMGVEFKKTISELIKKAEWK